MSRYLLLQILFLLITAVANSQTEKSICKSESNISALPQRRVLPYSPVREADILWEKKVWQVIDTREKMNHIFNYAELPFFELLGKAIVAGEITAYEDEQFTIPIDKEEIKERLFRSDTFEITDPVTYEIKIQVIGNHVDHSEIVRYRIKEVWFFDTRTSTMRVRILGIAPIRAVHRENNVLIYETPLFWIYYPDCRSALAQHLVYNEKNDKGVLSWEDLLEMRMFSSYIYKSTNVKSERLQDTFSGVELLAESEKIKQSIFNFEQDLWSY